MYILVIICSLIIGITTTAVLVNCYPRLRRKKRAAKCTQQQAVINCDMDSLNVCVNNGAMMAETPVHMSILANGYAHHEIAKMSGEEVHKRLTQRGYGIIDTNDMLYKSAELPPRHKKQPLPPVDLDTSSSNFTYVNNYQPVIKGSNKKLMRKLYGKRLKSPIMKDKTSFDNTNDNRHASVNKDNHIATFSKFKPNKSAKNQSGYISDDTLHALSLEQLNRVSSVDSASDSDVFVMAI